MWVFAEDYRDRQSPPYEAGTDAASLVGYIKILLHLPFSFIPLSSILHFSSDYSLQPVAYYSSPSSP